MKKIPSNIKSLAVLFVVSGLMAGALCYWFGTQIDEKTARIGEIHRQMETLSGGGVLPTRNNLKGIQANDAKLAEILNSVQAPIQKASANFASVRGPMADGKETRGLLDPDSWKRLFGEKREQLRKLAAANKVTLPEDYDFGFKAYRLTSPRADTTLDLGVQLLAIERVNQILFNARIRSLNGIKRVIVEEKRADASAGGLASFTQGDEAMPAAVVSGPNDTYKVYPFEFSFTSSTDALTDVVNKLTASDCFFVIRSLTVENEKNSIAKRSEIKAVASPPAAGGLPGVQPDESGAGSNKLVVPVVGQELLNVRMRVDLIDFLNLPAAASGGKKAPASGETQPGAKS